MLESRNGQPGSLFRLILRSQFIKLRGGDRFWYENDLQDLLTPAMHAYVKETTMRKVILRTNPELSDSDIPSNVFKWESTLGR